MALYMFRSPSGDIVANHHDLARPTPAHAVRESSLAAVESMREAARARRLLAEGMTMLTDPGEVPYDEDPITSGALSLERLAKSCGFETMIVTGEDWCRVEGLRRAERVGFRATWRRGATTGAAWCTPWRYELIQDTRPVSIDAKARTGKVGYRSLGMGVERLAIIGSPRGIPLGVTELRERIKEVGSAA